VELAHKVSVHSPESVPDIRHPAHMLIMIANICTLFAVTNGLLIFRTFSTISHNTSQKIFYFDCTYSTTANVSSFRRWLRHRVPCILLYTDISFRRAHCFHNHHTNDGGSNILKRLLVSFPCRPFIDFPVDEIYFSSTRY
jgi:hypothetical protein